MISFEIYDLICKNIEHIICWSNNAWQILFITRDVVDLICT